MANRGRPALLVQQLLQCCASESARVLTHAATDYSAALRSIAASSTQRVSCNPASQPLPTLGSGEEAPSLNG